MLLASSRLLDLSVMSLQTGGQLAMTSRLVIDPRSLKVLALELSGRTLAHQPSYLLVSDIREISSIGIIVDSADEFVGSGDVIKVKEVIDFGFLLPGITVRDESGRKLGKVDGFSIEPTGFFVKQLSVRRPLLKSFTDTELLIDRDQIVNVSNDAITIKNDARAPAAAKRAANAYTNPFRGHSPQPEAIHRSQR